MRQESNAWAMGKFADVKNDALAYANSFAKTFGFDTSKNGSGRFADLDDRVADFQGFVKNAGQLARAATKEVSSRAAFQELQFINNTLPSPEMSAGGFQRVADQMQSVNDYALGRQAAATQWKIGHGTLEGFDASFNQSVSPGAYLLHRMDVPTATQFFANAQKTSEGQAMVGRLVTIAEHRAPESPLSPKFDSPVAIAARSHDRRSWDFVPKLHLKLGRAGIGGAGHGDR
jgi:hypothetical protein